MAAPLILALLGLLALGAVLAILGLRGRRLNDHPVCRQCRFDLHGLYPGAVTCPECGAGLKRPGFVRIGARRRRWTWVGAGALLALLPVLMLCTLAFGIATGADLHQHKPAWLLSWEAPRVSGPASSAIAKELLKRHTGGALSAADAARAVAAALELQADPARPWAPEWGDLIEAAHAADQVGDAEFDRYLSQAAVLSLEVRPSVAQGDPIPMLITLKESRTGSTTQLYSQLIFRAAHVDGLPVGRLLPKSRQQWMASVNGRDSVGPASSSARDLHIGWMTHGGAGARLRLAFNRGDQTVPLVLDPSVIPEPGRADTPTTLPPGPHTLELSLTIDCRKSSAGRLWNEVSATASRNLTVAARFTIAGPDAGPRLVTDESFAAAMHAALEPGPIRVYADEDNPSVFVTFHPGNPPVGAAYDVILESAGRSWQLGSFVSGRAADDLATPSAFSSRDSLERRIAGLLPGFSGETATIVLRPNPELAKSTLDMTTVYMQELRYENLKVQWQGEEGEWGLPTR